ncbi:MAG: hypothetical protein WB799_08860 [Candidatus Sulfotelmatobacter sp.]
MSSHQTGLNKDQVHAAEGRRATFPKTTINRESTSIRPTAINTSDTGVPIAQAWDNETDGFSTNGSRKIYLADRKANLNRVDARLSK